MKKSFFFLLFSLLFVSTILISGCKGGDPPVDPPPVQNEEEIITTLTLNFTDSAGVAAPVTATFRDPDGDGGNGPDIFDEIELESNTTYNCSLTLLNETVSPADDITVEVLEEDDEHFFCYDAGSSVEINIERTDTDGVYEVGLETAWRTGNTSTGSVLVTLKHQPDGIKDGTCTPGDTDIEIQFIARVL